MALFFADAILSKKGPLARVWLAAHYERKLSKAQTLQTDIGQSAKAIESRPLALRISGQLLLGVCRIYSRKAKYLLDDCNEALVKIKLAFRPGVVDMTDEQLAVPTNAITLQGDGFNLDLFGDTWDFDTTRKTGGRHLAREADINLPMQEDFLMTIDGGGDWNFDMDGGFGDLDLNFGEVDNNELEEDSMAVEMARDAAPTRSTRESLASALRVRTDNAELDGLSTREGGDFGDMEMDVGEVADLNLDFGDYDGFPVGDPFGDRPDGGSARSSPPTEAAPATPIDPGEEEVPTKKSPKKRQIKERKQVIDSVTELNDAANRRGGGAQNSFSKADVSAITTHHGYLPDSVTVMRLMEIRADPLAHFFATKVTDAGSFYCVAPPGLAPEISDLYLFPASQGAGQKRKSHAHNDRAAKRQHVESDQFDDVEQLRARAGSVVPSIRPLEGDGGGFEEFGDESGFIPNNDDSMPLDNFQFEVDDSLHINPPAASSPIAPAGLVDDDCAVAMFDTQPTTQDTSMASSSQQSPQKDEAVNKDGYSRNTVKAIGLLRQELGGNDKRSDGALSFSTLTEGGSRRAASSFFFELLVLGTRDCVKLTQSKPFADINIKGKSKLWEGRAQDEDLPQSEG